MVFANNETMHSIEFLTITDTHQKIFTEDEWKYIIEESHIL